MAYRKVSDNSLKKVADAIREKAGSSEVLIFPDGFTKAITGIKATDEEQVYILVDESGNEVTAVLVEEETVFDATANDIRLGKVAATEAGVTVGTKEIPAYHTTEGFVGVLPGKEFVIQIPKGSRYDYTKLQAIICSYTKSLTNSVAAEKVSINSKVYPVGSTEELSIVTVNHEEQSIDLGITNEGTTPCVIRYFTYKEET